MSREAGCGSIWWWHHNIWLHFAASSYASLSCPVLLIWPLYREGSVMSVTPTPLPMCTDRPLSRIRPHVQKLATVGVARVTCHSHSGTQTPVYLSSHGPNTCRYKAAAGPRGQMWDPCPGGNDRFRGCCG